MIAGMGWAFLVYLEILKEAHKLELSNFMGRMVSFMGNHSNWRFLNGALMQSKRLPGCCAGMGYQTTKSRDIPPVAVTVFIQYPGKGQESIEINLTARLGLLCL